MADEFDLYSFKSITDVPADDDPYTLDEILAEYGSSLEQKLTGEAKPSAPPAPQSQPEAPQVTEPEEPDLPPVIPEPEADLPAEEPPEAEPEPIPEPPAAPRKKPRGPKPISMEDLVGSTVNAVIDQRQEMPDEEDEEDEVLLRPRRRLFSRRKLEDTEELYQSDAPEPEPDPEPIGPEQDFSDAAAFYKKKWKQGRSGLLPAAVLALIPTVLMFLDTRGIAIPYWSGDLRMQTMILLALLALSALLCRQVFVRGVQMLLRRRFVVELLVSLSVLLTAGDSLLALLSQTRTAVIPYASITLWTLLFTQWGLTGHYSGMYSTYHTAELDPDPPYLITDTTRGACKQKGSVPGFYSTAARDDFVTLCQTALLPMVLVASFVFAGLSSLGQGRGSDFLLNWSAILTAGCGFSHALCWGLPWSHLTARLQKIGCAIAGWAGADKISRQRAMILSDTDLFPPGALQLNGIRVYGEEMKVAVSHAASMAREAGCGLERLFDGVLRSELGHYEHLDNFSFDEKGGYVASFRGETLMMGTASFMRKMEVILPGDINLKTGIFLAVDRELIAVFAVKYNPAENVDFALRILGRGHITAILASRDPNITPALLKRKFYKRFKVEYPDLTERIALSEVQQDRDLPRALLFREGLLPYAEVVAGSRRLCHAVRRACILSMVGSAAGVLLSFYMVFQSAYHLLSPLALLTFLLLWLLPVLLMTDSATRY